MEPARQGQRESTVIDDVVYIHKRSLAFSEGYKFHWREVLANQWGSPSKPKPVDVLFAGLSVGVIVVIERKHHTTASAGPAIWRKTQIDIHPRGGPYNAFAGHLANRHGHGCAIIDDGRNTVLLGPAFVNLGLACQLRVLFFVKDPSTVKHWR